MVESRKELDLKTLKKSTKLQEHEEFYKLSIKILLDLNVVINDKEKKKIRKLFSLMMTRTHLNPLMIIIGFRILSNFLTKESEPYLFEEVELFLISSCILAQKFYEDVFWNNKLYIDHLNLSVNVKAFSKIEFYILEKLDWKINYSAEEVDSFICKFQ